MLFSSVKVIVEEPVRDDKIMLKLPCEHCTCGWSNDAESQGISSHGINIDPPNDFGFTHLLIYKMVPMLGMTFLNYFNINLKK